MGYALGIGQRGFPVAPKRVERKLAAILAADVAGYSRLMGADEEGTLARLKAHRRELIDPKISEHRGRVVKTTSDGILIEFASVVDALRCAVEVTGVALRDRGIDPVSTINRGKFPVEYAGLRPMVRGEMIGWESAFIASER